MIAKIYYSNCEDGDGAFEIRIIKDSNSIASTINTSIFKKKVEKLLENYAEENKFMTSAHFFVDMLATHGIIAEELKYDLEIY